MPYCQTGERAHLWTSDPSHWVFDGPIDVQVVDLAKADTVPGTSPTTTINCVYYENKNSPGGIGCVGIGERPSGGNLTWIRGFGGYYWGLIYSWSGGYAWTGITGNVSYRPGVYGVGRDCNLVFNKADQVLRVSRNGSKLIDIPWNPSKSFSVRCGDRCPPGMKWNDRCGKCVCENMGALKWHLGNAADIARLI